MKVQEGSNFQLEVLLLISYATTLLTEERRSSNSKDISLFIYGMFLTL
jgi:hypothetical protein